MKEGTIDLRHHYTMIQQERDRGMTYGRNQYRAGMWQGFFVGCVFAAIWFAIARIWF